MDVRCCEECDRGYVYVDSPPAEKCFCGGELIDVDKLTAWAQFKLGDVEYPTVSC